MSQRIRYIENSPGVLTSRRFFILKSGHEVVVELDLNTMSFKLVDNVTGDVVANEAAKTINKSVLKIRVKERLATLGVKFEDEKRKERGYRNPHTGMAVDEFMKENLDNE